MREPSKMRHATPVKPTVPNATKKRLPWTKRILEKACMTREIYPFTDVGDKIGAPIHLKRPVAMSINSKYAATKKRLPWTKRMLDLLCAAIAEKRAHCLHKWVDIGGGEFCAHCGIKKRETP